MAMVIKSMKIFAGPSYKQDLSTASICLSDISYQLEILGKGRDIILCGWNMVVLTMTLLSAETLLKEQCLLCFAVYFVAPFRRTFQAQQFCFWE